MNTSNFEQMITDTLSGFVAMSNWEYLAVALAVAYLLFAIKQSLWCWPAAFFSTLIYTVLFFNGALLMESVLNVYYMLMAIYGFYAWRKHKVQRQNKVVEVELAVQSWSLNRHALICTLTTIIALFIGYFMTHYTQADFAYLDSFTTCFAVVTTYLVTQKVLENWLYWIVIDGASIYLFVEKGFYPTAVLFVFYTVMAAWGFKTWFEIYDNNRANQDENLYCED